MQPSPADMTEEQALNHHWDAIVIGTGVGGGTVGRALAEAGQKVLFLEMGFAGHRSENNGLSEVFVPEARLLRGFWPTPLHATQDGVSNSFYAPLGSGVGGSSVFYAATLERPERHDLDDLRDRPHPTGGWPVDFDSFLPWYDKATKIFRVYGEQDPLSSEPPLPLRSPPQLNETEHSLMGSLKEAGLHPYHQNISIERVKDCKNCLGKKCPKTCKMDGRSAGVEPAMHTGNAYLMTGAKVTRLEASARHISRVHFERNGNEISVSGKQIVLAAGALSSPRVLLASKNDEHPKGLANQSGLVGRNLMFHSNDLFAVWPRRGTPDVGPAKAISFRDFYFEDGKRLGTAQAVGIRATYGGILHFLDRNLARSRWAKLRGLSIISRIVAAIAYRIFGTAHIFVGLVEDMPYRGNRVLFDENDPDRLAVEYTSSKEFKSRRTAFRRAVRKGLRGHRHFFVSARNELNWGHPCGTLCFGKDPKTSVLRADCRSHEIENLWVTDASFLPTSMGVNPSLTIAANAMRVAEHIVEENS